MTTPEHNIHQPNQISEADRAPLLLRLAAGAGEVLINAFSGGTNPVDAIGREIDERIRQQRAFESAMTSRNVLDDSSEALGEEPSDSPC